MAIYALRFDLRNPSFAGVSMADRYAAALDMAAWADERGFRRVVLSEHHGEDDGFMSSPLTLAAAIAAVTTNVRIRIAAMIPAMHNPIRLAEDLATVDLVSRGRLEVVLASGYITEHFEMFGEPMPARFKRTRETVAFLERAWSGEPFTHEGRTVRVTPRPARDGGPRMLLGGAVEASARRAARLGYGYLPAVPECWAFYRDELVALGQPDPGPYVDADLRFFHLSEDPEAAWEKIRAHVRHEAVAYAGYATPGTNPHDVAVDPEQLRASGMYRVVTPEELGQEITAAGDTAYLQFHPMMGGISPELAWDSLHLLEQAVLPEHPAA